MITTIETGNIIYDDCAAFGLPRSLSWTLTGKEITREEIVIVSGAQQPGEYWRTGNVEVNLCVPDDSDGKPRIGRLTELEKEANDLFGYVAGTYGGTRYRYMIESISQEEDSVLGYHYIQVKLIFKMFNVKKML